MRQKLILRRRGFEAFEGYRLWIQLLMFLSIAVLLMSFLMFRGSFPLHLLPHMSLFFCYGIFLYFYIQFMRKAHLIVDEFGLQYKNGLPDFLQKLSPEWRISWSEIKSVSFAKSPIAKNRLIIPMLLGLQNKTMKLYPMQWVTANTANEEIKNRSFNQRFFASNPYAHLKIENMPLYHIFTKKGLLKKNAVNIKPPESEWTDINSSPIGLAMAGFVFFSLFYFIGDVYFGLSEFYVETPPYVWFLGVALVVAILAYLVLIASRFKPSEKIMLAILVGIGAGFISYPIMLRINEWTDTSGLQGYQYKLAERRTWKAIDNNQLPDLVFDLKSSDYWAQFKPGKTKQFELRKGGLGFYQVNMTPIYDEQRIFYKDR